MRAAFAVEPNFEDKRVADRLSVEPSGNYGFMDVEKRVITFRTIDMSNCGMGIVSPDIVLPMEKLTLVDPSGNPVAEFRVVWSLLDLKSSMPVASDLKSDFLFRLGLRLETKDLELLAAVPTRPTKA